MASPPDLAPFLRPHTMFTYRYIHCTSDVILIPSDAPVQKVSAVSAAFFLSLVNILTGKKNIHDLSNCCGALPAIHVGVAACCIAWRFFPRVDPKILGTCPNICLDWYLFISAAKYRICCDATWMYGLWTCIYRTEVSPGCEIWHDKPLHAHNECV